MTAGAGAAGSALARCVGDVPEFARVHWGRRPMIRRHAGPFDDLLDVAAVERLLLDLGRRPTFRLVRDGSPVPPADYTVRTRVGGVDIDDVADVDRILDLVAAGSTLVMQGLQRCWPPLARFCLAVEADLGHAVQANAYLSPPDAAGLARHHDRHDVIVLQVSGAKQWEVGGVGDVHLAAGDVAYLPAGTSHAARTAHAPSLHITLGLLTTTYRQVLHRILDALEDPNLDRALPLGFATDRDAGALRAGLTGALGATARAFDGLDVDDVTRREVARRQRRARRRWTGRLEVAVDPAAVHDATMCRGRRAMRVGCDGDATVLDLPDRRLRLPGATAAALRLLATGEVCRVGDLPGLDPDDRLVVVRRLVREGAVEVLRDERRP